MHDAGVLRRLTGTDHRTGDDRGGDATDLPYSQVAIGREPVRPHRLRHTYGTELAEAGIDLLVLRELMGHVSPETTAGYVHLSAESVAVEFARAKGIAR